MDSAEEPPPEFSTAGELVVSVVFGAILFGALGAAKAAVTDDGMLVDVVNGAIGGGLLGLGWFWTARRAKKFRATFDPDEQTVTRPTGATGGAAAVVSPDRSPRRRYRSRHAVIVSVVALAVYLGLAAFLSGMDDPAPTPGALAIIWGACLLPGWMLAMTWFTFVDVGPTGLRVSRLLRRDTIAWSELREVRWLRKSEYDVLLVVTNDGREIKANAVLVRNTGYGRDRGARVLADIEQTWTAAR